jgi:hypothetical protein
MVGVLPIMIPPRPGSVKHISRPLVSDDPDIPTCNITYGDRTSSSDGDVIPHERMCLYYPRFGCLALAQAFVYASLRQKFATNASVLTYNASYGPLCKSTYWFHPATNGFPSRTVDNKFLNPHLCGSNFVLPDCTNDQLSTTRKQERYLSSKVSYITYSSQLLLRTLRALYAAKKIVRWFYDIWFRLDATQKIDRLTRFREIRIIVRHVQALYDEQHRLLRKARSHSLKLVAALSKMDDANVPWHRSRSLRDEQARFRDSLFLDRARPFYENNILYGPNPIHIARRERLRLERKRARDNTPRQVVLDDTSSDSDEEAARMASRARTLGLGCTSLDWEQRMTLGQN